MPAPLPPRVVWREREPGESLRDYTAAIDGPMRFWNLAVEYASYPNALVKERLAAFGGRYGDDARLRLREGILVIRAEAQKQQQQPLFTLTS